MAKKKKRKEEKEPVSYSNEVVGIMLILISIIGLCKFGFVGDIVKDFAVFLAGELYAIILVMFILVGIYMIVKREKPNFLSSKLFGIYFITISILVLAHLTYANDYKGVEIINKSFNNICAYIKNPTSTTIVGGGMIGSLFSTAFLFLFDKRGTLIVSIVLIVIGAIMFTGLSAYDIIQWLKQKRAENREKREARKNEIVSEIEDEDEEEDEEDGKLTVTSLEELTHPGKKQAELLNIDPETGEIIEAVTEVDEESMEKVYYCPPVTLLNKPKKSNNNSENLEAVKNNAPVLENVLAQFDITGKVITAHVGPTVTQYEIEVKTGTKLNKILAINREIALAMAAKEVRIQAPIPGRSTVGIELPNATQASVSVREVLEKETPKEKENKLNVVLGRDIMGEPKFCAINKTPHLLVAGSTGSGKSVCINSIIISILMNAKPDEVKLVLVDPKKVEFSMYNGVPHLLAPVVTDAKKANIALKKMVAEMENRYELFENSKTKKIEDYNAYIEKLNEKLPDGEKKQKLPYIVIIIDELADLMMVAAKEVQDSIMRITQMARAAGMHLIVATQRPSTNVITGVIKANIPSRIAFAVSSGIDSRTILDGVGAEKLLGKGDMLYLPQGENTPLRIQGTFISDEEIKRVVDYTIKQQKARYDETLTMDAEEMNAKTSFDGGSKDPEGQDYDPGEDPLYDQVVEFVVQSKKASTSLVQRRFRIGYNRAANLIDKLEERGIVGPQNGSKPREVLVKIEGEE